MRTALTVIKKRGKKKVNPSNQIKVKRREVYRDEKDKIKQRMGKQNPNKVKPQCALITQPRSLQNLLVRKRLRPACVQREKRNKGNIMRAEHSLQTNTGQLVAKPETHMFGIVSQRRGEMAHINVS